MSRRSIVRLSAVAYGILGAIAIAWCVLRQRPYIVGHPAPWLTLEPWLAHGVSLALGVTLAVLTVCLNRVAVARLAFMQRLHLGFREVLGQLDARGILVVALSSGIGEELFFRAALQPAVGFVIASLIFGLIHVAPDRRFVIWTAWAVLMGFVFGAIYEATGSLLGAVVAHVWINHENLHFIVQHDPSGTHRVRAPRLVGRVERR